jgi:hypothetical protein
MNKIKYVGPFYQVRAEGILFTRHLSVEVPSATSIRLLSAVSNGVNVFEEVDVTQPAKP